MKSKKLLAILLALTVAVSAFALTACGDTSKSSSSSSSSEAAKIYQFTGKYAEGGSFAATTNNAFLLNLNADGTAVLDSYKYANYDASPAAENKTFFASYMSGTWKLATKDDVECIQIKLALINEDGTTSNDGTYYAYEVAGEYTFELNFPLVPGMSFSRQIVLSGKEGKIYNDADSFIQAFKAIFVAPESVGTFVDSENNGTAYLQADGTLLLYNGYSEIATGAWGKDASSVTIKIGEAFAEVTLDGNKASFGYSYDMAGYATTDFVFVIADFTKLPDKTIEKPDGPVAENVYNGSVTLQGATAAKLTLTNDTECVLNVYMDLACTYVKIGDAVVLTPKAAFEGYAASIWTAIPHTFLLNAEDKTMTNLNGAYNTDKGFVFYLTSDTNLTIIFSAYSMRSDAFTYAIAENVMTVTAGESISAGFKQVWGGVGAAEWTIDGTTATVKVAG